MVSTTVVLWGGPSETEEVLKAVFEPRGYTIRRWNAKSASRANSGDGRTTEVERTSSPQLVVVDQDDRSVPPCDRWTEVPRIIIGRAVSRADFATANGTCATFASPFDYRDLIGAIEALL